MGQKVKFVLSDLHLNAGNSRAGRNSHENGLAAAQVVRFLRTIIQESEQTGQEIELIINGDFLDFLQVPAVKGYHPTASYPLDVYLDSSETASILRLDNIYNSHRPVFEALANFMQITVPQRRLTIIKGTHDVHFFWPRVKSRLRELLNASGTRSSLLLFAEEFVSREKIYIEHGHQRAETITRYPDFRNPLHPSNPNQLDYPPGSRLISELSPQMSGAYPFIAQIKPITTVIWCALQWDQALAAKLLAKLADREPASVTATAAGKRPLTFGQSLQNEDDYYQLLQRSLADPLLHQQMIEHVHHQLNPPGENGHSIPLETKLNSDQSLLAIAQSEQQHCRQQIRQAAQSMAEQEGAQIVLFGHTHSPCQETLKNGAIYVNTGCWADEDLSDASPETWADLFQNGYTASSPNPLPYARIDYDADQIPTVQLLDFTTHSAPATTTGLALSKKFIDWLSRWRSDRQA